MCTGGRFVRTRGTSAGRGTGSSSGLLLRLPCPLLWRRSRRGWRTRLGLLLKLGNAVTQRPDFAWRGLLLVGHLWLRSGRWWSRVEIAMMPKKGAITSAHIFTRPTRVGRVSERAVPSHLCAYRTRGSVQSLAVSCCRLVEGRRGRMSYHG
jgi:hypothetical protein